MINQVPVFTMSEYGCPHKHDSQCPDHCQSDLRYDDAFPNESTLTYPSTRESSHLVIGTAFMHDFMIPTYTYGADDGDEHKHSDPDFPWQTMTSITQQTPQSHTDTLSTHDTNQSYYPHERQTLEEEELMDLKMLQEALLDLPIASTSASPTTPNTDPMSNQASPTISGYLMSHATSSITEPPIQVHSPPPTMLSSASPVYQGASPTHSLFVGSGVYAADVAPSLEQKKAAPPRRICRAPGCTKGIRSRGLCKAHGGGRRCTTPGCDISDQGGGHCIAHGGGRRCIITGCQKSAQSQGRCKLHGGARRCRLLNCHKNGQIKGLCRMHYTYLISKNNGGA